MIMSTSGSSKNISSASCSETDCTICAETISKRKIIKCPFCDFESCVDCVITFLMGIQDVQPRCMNNDCKKVWSGEFLATNTPYNFHNNTYRDRRADILQEREKSMLPGTQDLANRERNKLKNMEVIQEILDENAMLKELIRKNNDRIRKLRWDPQYRGFPEEKKEEKQFTRACPIEDCRGFLSTSLKCGTCSTWACKDCHMPKQSKNDPEHKCDPDLVATVLDVTQTIQSLVRPAPLLSSRFRGVIRCTVRVVTLLSLGLLVRLRKELFTTRTITRLKEQ